MNRKLKWGLALVAVIVLATLGYAIASPAGIDRLLVGDTLRPAGMATNAPFDPLASAQTRFESASLFTASVPNAQGKPLVFEFRRDGLSWKLTGLRLPEN